MVVDLVIVGRIFDMKMVVGMVDGFIVEGVLVLKKKVDSVLFVLGVFSWLSVLFWLDWWLWWLCCSWYWVWLIGCGRAG